MDLASPFCSFLGHLARLLLVHRLLRHHAPPDVT